MKINVLALDVGTVTEDDIRFCETTNAHIIAFNVKAQGHELDFMSREKNVEIHNHKIIYDLLDKIGELLLKLAPMCEDDVVKGEAEVMQIFQLKGKRLTDVWYYLINKIKCLNE